MTSLNKAIKRMSEAVIRDGGKRRRLVVVLYPNDTLGLRPEKTRREERISLEACYGLAVKQRVAAERREKKQQLKQKRRKL